MRLIEVQSKIKRAVPAIIPILVLVNCLFCPFLEGFQQQGKPSIEAINTLSKYLRKDERLYLITKIMSPENCVIEIVCIIPKNQTNQEVREVLSDWGDNLISRGEHLFPVVPVDENGRIDYDNLDFWINQASLAARVDPRVLHPSSPHKIIPEDAQKVEKAYQAFFIYHLFDDPQLSYSDTLEAMLSSIALEHLGIDRDSLPEAMKITAKTIEYLRSSGLWVAEKNIATQANKAWNAAFNIARQSGYTFEDAMALADQSSWSLDRLWNQINKHKKLGDILSLGIAQGSAVLERVLVALTPVIFLDEADHELTIIRKLVPLTKDGLLLRKAIDRILPRVRGEADVFTDKLTQSLASQEFLADIGIPALNFVVKLIVKKAAGWEIPFIGKLLFALDVGFFLGDLLTNNSAIGKEFKAAKYAKEMEAIFHLIAFEDLYSRLQNQLRHGFVQGQDIEGFDAAVCLTLLSESYFWRKITTGLNSTTSLKNALDSFIHGTSGPEQALLYMPYAEAPAKDYSKWCRPAVVQELINTTLERLQGGNDLVGKWVIRLDCSNASRGKEGYTPEGIYQWIESLPVNIPKFYAYWQGDLATGKIIVHDIVERRRSDVYLLRFDTFLGPFNLKSDTDRFRDIIRNYEGDRFYFFERYQIDEFRGQIISEERLVGPTEKVSGVLLRGARGSNRIDGFKIKNYLGEEINFEIFLPASLISPGELPTEEERGKRFLIEYRIITYKRGGAIIGQNTEVLKIERID